MFGFKKLTTEERIVKQAERDAKRMAKSWQRFENELIRDGATLDEIEEARTEYRRGGFYRQHADDWVAYKQGRLTGIVVARPRPYGRLNNLWR